jgi:hypothetical protein
LIHLQRATRVVTRRLLRLGLAVHSTPAPDDPLDVLGGAGAADRQQPLFGLRGGHAGQLADLGVRQLAAGERPRQPWQRAERARHPHVLPGRARCEPHAPGQPGRAGAEAIAPAATSVELADEIEEAGGRRVEVRRQLGDFVAEAIEILGVRFGRVDVHGESSSCWGDSIPQFRRDLEGARSGDRGATALFRRAHPR